MDDRKDGTVNATKATHRHHSVGQENVSSVLNSNEVLYDPENPDQVWDADEEVLAALGYKPEFKREFNLYTTFSVSFAVLGLLPSFASTLYYSLFAGTAALSWGWLVAMMPIQCVAMSMAELASSMPTSGGLYYAAAVLAPPGWGPMASWITGWSNWLSQITASPSINYGIGSIILTLASYVNPEYSPTNYQIFLISIGLTLSQSLLACLPTKHIATFNSWGSTINMATLIATITLIPAATNREHRNLTRFTPSSEVWGDIENTTEWPNGIAILMSFLSVIWTMSGYDSPFHLAEECSNANIATPRAIVMTSTFGGIFGFFLQLVVAYTIVDIPAAIAADQPFAAYAYQVLPDRAAVAVLSMTIVAGFFMGQANQIAASRVTFAYARDGCFPFSNQWKKVNSVTKTPVNAVLVNAAVGCVLLLLLFGGPLAAEALFSIGAISSFVSFTVPIFIRLFYCGDRFRPGPWNLGRASYPIGIFGVSFVVLMLPILCFPSQRVGYPDPLNAAGMNWTALVYGGPMLFVMIWWFVSAHKWFKGPRINLEHTIFYDNEQIEGMSVKGTTEVLANDAGSSSGSDKEKKTEL